VGGVAHSKSDGFLVQVLRDAGLPWASPSALRFLSALESNSFGVWGGTARGGLLGRALYPHASFFNHSCAPNCEAVQTPGTAVDPPRVELVVRAPVAAGTELCVHYIDCDAPVAARRTELLRAYRFVCQCDRCVRESTPGAARVHVTYAQSVNHHAARRRPPHKKKMVAPRGGRDAVVAVAVAGASTSAPVQPEGEEPSVSLCADGASGALTSSLASLSLP
jgi:hypothetical protein